MESFVTLDELGAYLSPRAPLDLDGDVMAQLAIDGASELITTLSEQEILARESTAIFRLEVETRDLLLPQVPLTEVSEVRVDGDVDLEWIPMAAGMVRRVSDFGSIYWPVGAEIEVDYAHGYDQIPAELKLLALTLAARAYHQGIARQESTGGTSVTYSVSSSLDLSAGEKNIIAKYRHPKAPVLAEAAGS